LGERERERKREEGREGTVIILLLLYEIEFLSF